LLQASDIPALETAGAADPNNLEIRMKLLGYYFAHDRTMTGPLRPKVTSKQSG
jgi:hypothetical protein